MTDTTEFDLALRRTQLRLRQVETAVAALQDDQAEAADKALPAEIQRVQLQIERLEQRATTLRADDDGVIGLERLSTQLDDISASLQAIEATLAAHAKRLKALERRPFGGGGSTAPQVAFSYFPLGYY